MNLRKFFVGRAIGTIILLVIIGLVVGFYALNNFIYKEKQGDVGVSKNDTPQIQSDTQSPVFTWRYAKADSMNLDGQPKTDVFLVAKYSNGKVEEKLIDTSSGGCNDLPDRDEDSVPNSTNAQCYGAGLGYRFKITKGENSYLVLQKKFEEGLPDYAPPSGEYKVVSEFPF